MRFDFAAVTAPFRMQPGLRRLAPGAAQLTPVRPGAAHLMAKLEVLSHHPDQALLQAEGFDAGPALRALVRHACQEHPDAFTASDAGAVRAVHLGWGLSADGQVRGDGPAALGACLCALRPQWRLAGLMSLALAEDLAVIEGSGRVAWAAVCLPSHWAPEDKVGHSFAQVHAPVADNQRLLAAADHLARLVTGADRWERFVWTINPHASLDQHPRRIPELAWPDGSSADAEQLAAQAYLRTERQTFIPVAAAAQAVFTIDVQVLPLVAAVQSADQAGRLRAALATMSDAVLAYRGLTPARTRLLRWLDRRTSDLGGASLNGPS